MNVRGGGKLWTERAAGRGDGGSGVREVAFCSAGKDSKDDGEDDSFDFLMEQIESRGDIGDECGDTFLATLPNDIAATVRILGSAVLTPALKVSSCDYSPGGGNHGVTPWYPVVTRGNPW
jgi:hypothetical protein